MKFGDIYLVNCDPSVGHEYKKVRPAVVIQMQEISARSALVTVMPISSQVEKFTIHDVFVEKDHKNRLSNDSIVRVQHISSFDRSRFIKKIGETNSPVIRKIRGYLRKHFGL
jgi:mRNA interferase MazF